MTSSSTAALRRGSSLRCRRKPGGLLPWRGDSPVRLDGRNRYLDVVHGVRNGRCALFDTETGDLTPFGEG
jgi:hypothetical protein